MDCDDIGGDLRKKAEELKAAEEQLKVRMGQP